MSTPEVKNVEEDEANIKTYNPCIIHKHTLITKILLVKIMIAHFYFCGGPQLIPIDDRAVILNSNLDAALSLANKKKEAF